MDGFLVLLFVCLVVDRLGDERSLGVQEGLCEDGKEVMGFS